MKLLNQTTLLRWVIPIALGMGILTYLITKSLVMQITCDEAYTVEILAKQPIWDLVSYKSSYTNNHILNTLLVKFLFFIFNSIDHSLARVPNIAAFILYFYYCFRFSQRFIADNWLSLMFLSVMCCNPYLLDFFALIRGYGLSIGLMMASIYYAARFLLANPSENTPPRVLNSWRGLMLTSILFSILSVYAQFATLHFYLGLNLLVVLYLLKNLFKNKDKKVFFQSLGILFSGFLLITCLLYAPITAILKDNQIAYYGKDGFWENTMSSIITGSLYSQGYLSQHTVPVFKILSLVTFFILIAYLAYILSGKSVEKSEKTYPSVFSTILFVCTALSTILQFHLLDNQYVVDRTALFFYPLFALLLPTIPLFLARFKKGVGVFLCVFFIAFPLNHIIRAGSLTSYREWWYDTHTFEILDLLKQEYEKTDKKQPLRLNTTWMFHPSFLYHRGKAKMEWLAPLPFNSNPDTIQVYDFYYTTRDEMPALQSKYEKVKEWDDGQWVLMKWKK
jgi:hypothetical protein